MVFIFQLDMIFMVKWRERMIFMVKWGEREGERNREREIDGRNSVEGINFDLRVEINIQRR